MESDTLKAIPNKVDRIISDEIMMAWTMDELRCQSCGKMIIRVIDKDYDYVKSYVTRAYYSHASVCFSLKKQIVLHRENN